jgi:ribonucleoside-diphosphate reductase protein NrdI
MICVYDSMTGQTKKAATKLGFNIKSVVDYQVDDDEVVFLVTRSFGFGEVPKNTLNFLETYADRVIGCAVSGNVNWGENYGKAGFTIEKKYGIPLVLKFESSGFESDISHIKNWIHLKLKALNLDE